MALTLEGIVRAADELPAGEYAELLLRTHASTKDEKVKALSLVAMLNQASPEQLLLRDEQRQWDCELAWVRRRLIEKLSVDELTVLLRQIRHGTSLDLRGAYAALQSGKSASELIDEQISAAQTCARFNEQAMVAALTLPQLTITQIVRTANISAGMRGLLAQQIIDSLRSAAGLPLR